MSTLIVNPNNRIQGEFSGIEPPLWAALIATRIGQDVSILDAEALNLSVAETLDRSQGYDNILIVVMGNNPSASSTPKMPVTKKLAEMLKNVSVTGLHPLALKIQTEQELGVPVVDYDLFGLTPAWDLLSMDRYRAHNWHCLDGSPRQPYGVVYTSMGCPFSCDFCNIHALYGKSQIQYRQPLDIIKEIGVLVDRYHVRNLKFWDELFTLNKKHVSTLCSLLIKKKYDLNIWAYARVDTVDEELLRLMKQAGINWLGYGIESASDEVRGVKKFKEAQIFKAIELTHKAGINVNGNFIFGLPEDNLATMQQSLDMAKALELEYVNFYVAIPYPGSKFYDDAVKQSLRLPKSWDAYSQFSPKLKSLATRYLRGEDVVEFRDWAFNNYFSSKKYLDLIKNKFGQQGVDHINNMQKVNRC